MLLLGKKLCGLHRIILLSSYYAAINMKIELMLLRFFFFSYVVIKILIYL